MYIPDIICHNCSGILLLFVKIMAPFPDDLPVVLLVDVRNNLVLMLVYMRNTITVCKTVLIPDHVIIMFAWPFLMSMYHACYAQVNR